METNSTSHTQEPKIPHNQDSNDTNSIPNSQANGKIKGFTKGANDLSLGISLVIAILLGLGFGYMLYKWLGYYWLIWVGLSYGIGAAILNVVKAYKKLHKDLESLKNDDKYKYMQDKFLEDKEQQQNRK